MTTALAKPRHRVQVSQVPMTVRDYGATAHDAADGTDPMFSQWFPFAASPDADLIPELGTMVGRSRDMFRNHGLAAGYRQTSQDNIIGSVLRLSSKPHYRLLGWNADRAHEWAQKTEAEFWTYASSTECDASRTSTLLGLTRQILGSATENGDAIAIPIWNNFVGARWNTSFMLVEGDRLSTPIGMEHRRDIRGGVHVNKHNAPIGYYVRKSHPGDAFSLGAGWSANVIPTQDDWEYIPAFDGAGFRRIIHLHDKDRAEATRAKPMIAAVMKEFKMAGKYSQEELKSAVTNSLIAAFVESNLDQTSLIDLFSSGAGSTDPAEINNYWLNQFAQNRAKLQGGAIIPMPLGAKVTGFNPGRPNPAFEAFMLSVLRHIAAGLNIPYELLTKDFSRTNYSSARAALLEAWRFFQSRRQWLIDQWLSHVYEFWMREAIDKGRVEAPDFYLNRQAYLRCRWIMSGRGWVDPLKEVKAARERIDGDLSNEEIECAEQGLDYEEVLEGQARILKKKRELGLLTVDGTGGGGPGGQTRTQDEGMEDPDEGDRREAETGSTDGLLVADLDISTRTERALAAAGIVYADQLIQMSPVQLLSIHGIGKAALREIHGIEYPVAMEEAA